ncbi:hypothetical protein BIW11_01510 [Tropilaelaps mercedesae]|uniref:Uncharacterized protein n=1 Tax=Tropilaelaps mercedesae TaxID=418985 RepID=A0A1V9XCT0_9ACAR|nr:hypothetical protein BIW11_01510 [Tropilaelaps mercedesae]
MKLQGVSAVSCVFMVILASVEVISGYLSDHHPGLLGAIATGWAGRNCEVAFPRCATKISIVTSSEPCRSGEACFKLASKNMTDNPLDRDEPTVTTSAGWGTEAVTASTTTETPTAAIEQEMEDILWAADQSTDADFERTTEPF